jgi:DNA-binding winged helix-turn-helix (wHTH) protein
VVRDEVVRLGDLVLDFAGRRMLVGGEQVLVTAHELAILEVLAAHPSRVVSREHLIEAVWGAVTPSAASSMEVLIARIRRKLGQAAALLRTVRGVGYALGEDGQEEQRRRDGEAQADGEVRQHRGLLHSHGCVGQENEPVSSRVGTPQTHGEQPREAGTEGPERTRERADDVVPSEEPRPVDAVLSGSGQGGLLDRQKQAQASSEQQQASAVFRVGEVRHWRRMPRVERSEPNRS